MTMTSGSKIRIVADTSVPFFRGVFEPWADVVYIEGPEIGPDDVRNADALVVTTTTRCDASLLEGSSIKLIASATSGVNHIDTEWCGTHGIEVRNAPGCNAGGVMEYIFSGIYATASRGSIDLRGKVIGIIGAGNIGKRVEAMGMNLGFKVLKNDPPREAAEGHYEFCSLDYLLAHSDIVIMLVPLGESTRGMVGRKFFSSMKKGSFFINAARGELVDDEALKKAIPSLGPVIIDTWNHEPDVDRELLSMVTVATPHIAGFSYQGKQNATATAVRGIARFFGIPSLNEFFPETDVPELEAVKLDLHDKSQGEIASVFQYNYPIFTDDFMFRMHPENFESLRAGYKYRREVYF